MTRSGTLSQTSSPGHSKHYRSAPCNPLLPGLEPRCSTDLRCLSLNVGFRPPLFSDLNSWTLKPQRLTPVREVRPPTCLGWWTRTVLTSILTKNIADSEALNEVSGWWTVLRHTERSLQPRHSLQPRRRAESAAEAQSAAEAACGVCSRGTVLRHTLPLILLIPASQGAPASILTKTIADSEANEVSYT
jgi:hypothetical protein